MWGDIQKWLYIYHAQQADGASEMLVQGTCSNHRPLTEQSDATDRFALGTVAGEHRHGVLQVELNRSPDKVTSLLRHYGCEIRPGYWLNGNPTVYPGHIEKRACVDGPVFHGGPPMLHVRLNDYRRRHRRGPIYQQGVKLCGMASNDKLSCPSSSFCGSLLQALHGESSPQPGCRDVK